MPAPAPLPGYAELDCLSNFSFLKGASHPEELVAQARKRRYEALALAETWEFQASYELSRGHVEAGLEDLAIAGQILQGRPEHRGQRSRICAEIAARISPGTPGLACARAEYAASARHLLGALTEYRELPS